MRYYKYISDGYILSIGKGAGYTEITQEEYDNLMDVIRNKPVAEEGYDYKLKIDLTWEQIEVPIIENLEEQSEWQDYIV